MSGGGGGDGQRVNRFSLREKNRSKFVKKLLIIDFFFILSSVDHWFMYATLSKALGYEKQNSEVLSHDWMELPPEQYTPGMCGYA